jgi:DNA-binding beta-propeller fold protein YncE
MTVLVNRAKMSTATTGTGSITLGSAVDGYQSFSAAGVSNADVVRYVIEDGSNWEIGTGTYGASGSTLSRTVSESSNAGAAINLSGAATVFIGAAAEDLPSVTAGTLTKSFASGETASISLSQSLSPAPVVSVTKEVAQEGISNGDWDVSADGSNYEIEDHAYAVDLLVDTGGGTITLGSGSWSSDDVGRRVVGNSGEVVIASADGSVATYDASAGADFPNDNTITSGNWNLFGLKFIASGVTLPEATSEVSSFEATYKIDNTPVFLNSFSVSSQDTGPRGIALSTDGTKMYMVGGVSDSVHQYSLSTALDLSTASYDNVSFSVASQDTLPQNITFNNDGTKMYIVGGSSDTFYQYSLSTAFDLSTASYDSVSFSVASQDNNPQGIAFNNDGTKMYMLGLASDSVYQYSLSTAFDLSTASYDSVSFSVSSQEATPFGIAFSNDGNRMYIVGVSSDTVYQYKLSAAFNLSTASYDGVSFSIADQNNSPYDLIFSNDGTKMYTVSVNARTVYEHVLAAPFFIDADIPYVSFSVTSQESGPQGIAFNNDGSKVYIVGSVSDSVHQYSVSTAFDLSTASYDSVSFSLASQGFNPLGMAFNNDGTKMYIVENTNDSVHQYSLSTAFDLSTASYDSVSFSVASQEINAREVTFNNDGTKMYIVGNDSDSAYQYSLSTAFDLSTASYDSVSFSVASQDSGPCSIAFNNDGTKMYMVGFSSDRVHQYSLSTAFNLSTASYDSVSFSVASQDVSPLGLAFSNDGTRMYIVGYVTDSVYEYRLAGPYSIQPKYTGASLSVSGQGADPYGIAFNNDGTKMYIVESTNDSVHQYSVSTAFDLSTASYDSVSFSLASQDTNPREIIFNNDGTKMYMVGNASNSVHQYSLSTAFDLSTASYDSVSFSVASQESGPQGITFNNDGTKMYIVGFISDSVHQYSLSTAFDLSTASYDSVSFSLASQDYGPREILFNTDGTKMYMVGGVSDSVHQYSLSTAFNVSTASYDSVSFSVASQDANPSGIAFNTDGSKMYMVGYTNDSVYEYNTGIGATLTSVTVVPLSQYFAAVTNSSGQINSTYWSDLNSMTASEALSGANAYYAVSTDDRTTWSVINEADGVRPIVRDNAGTWEYNEASVIVGWDISTASFLQNFSVAGQETSPSDIFFKPDGTKMYVIGYSGGAVSEYNLSTAWDVSTASYSQNFSVAGQETTPKSIFFKPDGLKMYVLGGSGRDVNEYDLSTAWDVSTASYSQNFSVSSQETEPNGLFFKPDGTKMYISGYTGDDINEYDLSTAWDISTASYSQNFSVAAQEATVNGTFFKTDGLKMYVVGATGDAAYEYNLSTAWDISTASYSQNFSVAGQESYPTNIFFKPDGLKMYLTGLNGDAVHEYDVGYVSYTTSTAWVPATTNSELYALQQALTDVSFNRMDSTQLEAVTDPNHYTLGDTLDLAIVLYTTDAANNPVSDGVDINYDANALNQGAILGTDYDYDFPDSTTVRVTSNATQNLKIRVV